MSWAGNTSDAARNYADGYLSHYTAGDMAKAVHSYVRVIENDPISPEAGYSRTQIGNIVRSVVPEKELLASQLELVLRHLETGDASAETDLT